MATRRPKRQTKRQRPYETSSLSSPDDPNTWNKDKLMLELKERGIEAPTTLSQKVLLQLFKANATQRTDNNRTNNQDIQEISGDARTNNVSNQITESSAANFVDEVRMNLEQRPTNSATSCDGNFSHVLNAFASMAESFSGLQNTVTQLIKSNQTQKIYDVKDGFTLQNWYCQNNADTSTPQISMPENQMQSSRNEIDNHGARSDSFTHIDIVSPSLQRQIIEDRKVPQSSPTRRAAAAQVSQHLRGNVELTRTVEHLWSHAVAKRTNSLYDIGFSHFKRFLLLNNVNCSSQCLPPVSEDILIYFVAHCFKVLKLKHTTIKLYLCGIRHVYMKSGCTNPLETSGGIMLPRLVLLLNSVKRLQGLHTRTRFPITFPILTQICQRLRKGVFNDYIDSLIETVCIVAFFAFLRCGEFTVPNNDKFNPSINVCLSDVIFHSDYSILRLKESKTDPFRKGIDIKLFEINNGICPLTALRKYVSKRNAKFAYAQNSDPLFVTNTYEALTRQYFLDKLKFVLNLCGYDSNLYNGHSFRSGAASSAGKARVEDHMIKVLGRWKSDSYCRYIKISPSSIKYAQQSLTEC